MLYLERFNYVIKHLPGTKNTLADALSRRPDLVPEGKDNEDAIAIPEDKFVNFISEELMTDIKNEYDSISDNDRYYAEMIFINTRVE